MFTCAMIMLGSIDHPSVAAFCLCVCKYKEPVVISIRQGILVFSNTTVSNTHAG